MLDIFGKAGLQDRLPISRLLLPHAAAPDSEGRAWDDLNATLVEVDKDTLGLGLQRISVFTFTVRAGISGCTQARRLANTLLVYVAANLPGGCPRGVGAMHTPVSYTHLTLPTTPYV